MKKFIWNPIEFDEAWKEVNTEKFDNIYPSWKRRRLELKKNEEQYERFLNQIKRKQAIDTGIIERMYDLKKGITETFIKEGFVDSYLQHGDTNISSDLLMSYLKDNFEAIDFIFDFVKSDRELSISYIKELHHLITQHQDYTEAIDQFGNRITIPMLKGEFKQNYNNPSRNGVKYCYCPPEQVVSEMDNLVKIYNSLTSCHVLIKAAFLHHAFAQIHPFQDGNGRVARLLASFVLIKEGLFPLSIDRDDRKKYIEALEKADDKEYQDIINVFANNQISSIEQALNFKTVENTSGYAKVIDLLEKKITDYKETERENRRNRIRNNMRNIFDVICERMEKHKDDIVAKLPDLKVENGYCGLDTPDSYFYAHQIIDYAKVYGYYVNLSLDKCWGRMFFEIDKQNKYRMVISLHHFGYDNSTFAIGAFLSKAIYHEDSENNIKREYVDAALGVPPLTVSSEKDVKDLTAAISQQIEISVMAALAYITNEL
ncbi:MAG: Fic family protein [Oscillospiraceae bacterium]|nr:Fic family protein [Oscillospiraceae bacterium]